MINLSYPRTDTYPGGAMYRQVKVDLSFPKNDRIKLMRSIASDFWGGVDQKKVIYHSDNVTIISTDGPRHGGVVMFSRTKIDWLKAKLSHEDYKGFFGDNHWYVYVFEHHLKWAYAFFMMPALAKAKLAKAYNKPQERLMNEAIDLICHEKGLNDRSFIYDKERNKIIE